MFRLVLLLCGLGLWFAAFGAWLANDPGCCFVSALLGGRFLGYAIFAPPVTEEA